jgi:hypothetical protein
MDPYYRRDQRAGISPPNLANDCSFAEHIVKARGKPTKFTSVSLSLDKIQIFGDTDYLLDQTKLAEDGHFLISHAKLIEELRRVIRTQPKELRIQAAIAMDRAKMRLEGLIDWTGFNRANVKKKDLMMWALQRIQEYFRKV